MNGLYIDSGITQSRAAVINDGIIENLYIENHDDLSVTGNIYLGRIENIVKGLNACFVNIGEDKNGILHIEEGDDIDNYKRGQSLLVQAIREGVDNKGPRLTQSISIPGRSVVLLPGNSYIYVSHKIMDLDVRKELIKLSRVIYNGKDGIIVRTEAEGEVEHIESEYNHLLGLWESIQELSKYSKPPCLLYNNRNFYDFVLREFGKKNIESIIINRSNDLNLISEILKAQGNKLSEKIIYDEKDINYQKVIEKEIKNALRRKILLPSGGYLVIDETEALTIIDVNSGGYIGDNNKEETSLNLNLEACKVIFNIVKLKNISGIILIDFVDMDEKINQSKVVDTLREEFVNDSHQNKIYGLTNLGIIEMTRAKKGKKLSEVANANNNIEGLPYILKLIENKCVELKAFYNKNSVNVYVNKTLLELIKTKFSLFVEHMKNIYNINVNFLRDDLEKLFRVGDENKDGNNNEAIIEINGKRYECKIKNRDKFGENEILIEVNTN